jgi:hypothetical protein
VRVRKSFFRARGVGHVMKQPDSSFHVYLS